MIVVDTNVVSEIMRSSPSPVVRDWLLGQPEVKLYTMSITVNEILYGIERLPEGQRKDALRMAATNVFTSIDEHVLPLDHDAAAAYAALVHLRDQRGLPIAGFDAQIAAICITHHATLATRNVQDFKHTGITVLDPWKAI